MTGRAGARIGVLAALVLAAGPALADFRGGGVLSGFSQGCAEGGWPVDGAVAVRVRHAPSELYGNPSQLTLALRGQTQHYAVWQTLEPAATATPAQGRTFADGMQLQAGAIRLQPLQRLVTERVNPALAPSPANAREMVLRVRIDGFDQRAGCSATLATVLRRF
jgi:hypothetical protein